MSKSWPRVRLGEVLTPTQRGELVDAAKEYRLLGVRLDGQGPFLRETVTGGQTAASRLFRVAKGDFIYSRLFACRGAFGVIGKEMDGCYVSGEFPTFVPIPGKIDLEYLKYWFRLPTVIARVDADCTGSTPLTRNRFKENFFLALEISLPPLSEQRRVVARIEELAAQIEEAKGLRIKAMEQVQRLVAAQTSTIFSNGEKTGWRRGYLGDYVLECNYGTSVKATDDISGTPILRMGNIQDGTLDVRTLKYYDLPEREKQKLLLRRGDIVVNRTNSADLVGKCAVFDLEGEFVFASYLIRLRLDTTKADPFLVASYVNSPAGRSYMFQERKQMTGQANVNSKKLKALPVSLPLLTEQRRIVAELDALQAQVDTLKRLQEETSKELDVILPSILDKAFKGEL